MKWFWSIAYAVCLSLGAANLLPNASFELSGRSGWGWLGDNNASELSTNIRVAYASAWHGSHVAEITGNGTTNIMRVVSLPVRLQPSTQYTFSVYLRESLGNSTANLEIENADGSDSTLSSQFSLTSSWQRFSVSHTTTSTYPSSYRVLITKSTSASTAEIQFDGAQLEVGGSATTWVPHANVEVGFDHHATQYGNTFDTGDTVAIPTRFYNYTVGPTNVTLDWSVRDWFNIEQATGETNFATLASGLTEYTLTLSSTNHGWRRVNGWLRNHDVKGDEITYSILPITNTLANLTNSLFGTHCVASPPYLEQMRAIGFGWLRTLSGVGVEAASNPLRWEEAEPTDNNFVYFDGDIANIVAADFKILGVLGESVGSTPAYALTNGYPDLDPFYLDYVTNVVTHYKDPIDYWELWNEPEAEGGLAGKAQLNVDILQHSYNIIKAIDDSGGYVVGPTVAGNEWDPGEHADQVILDLAGTNYVDILSHHTYPGPSVESIVGKVRAITDQVQYETWNTEGGKKIMSGFRSVPWEDVHTESVRYVRSHRYFGTMPLLNFPRFRDNWNSKYFYYDGRPMGPDHVENFSLFDWDQSLKPTAAAMAWHIKLLEESSLIGDLALANSAEGYTLTSPRHTSIGIFLGDTEILAGRTNVYHLTTTDSANCTFYDAVGNQVTYNGSIQFTGASPLYVTSPTATNTFHASFSVVTTNDTQAPNLAIVNGPRGVVADTTDRLFRWYAEDNAGFMRSTTDADDDAINFRYRLNAGSWSAWSHTNSVTYASITAVGLLEVEARDPAQNVASASWSWPDFRTVSQCVSN